MSTAPLYLAAYVRQYEDDEDLIDMFRDGMPVSGEVAGMLRGALSVLRKTGQTALPLPGLRLFGLDGVAVVVAAPGGPAGVGVVPRGQAPLTAAQVQAGEVPQCARQLPAGLSLVYVLASIVREGMQ